jgi:hypothetical protein
MNLPFSVSLIRNNFIDEGMKDDVSKRLNDLNVLEYGYNFNLSFRWLTDKFLFKSPAVYSINYQLGVYSNSKFTDQLFNTVFYGNAIYAGQTADFSGSETYDFQYDKIGFTAQNKITLSNSTLEIGAGISLVGVHSMTKFNLDHGSIYTDQYGEYIDADFGYEYLVSDSSNHSKFQFDGAGAAIDLQFSLLPASQKTRWTFYINNFGFANWNKNTRTYTADSTLHFEGLEVNNLFSPDDSSLIQYNIDSLLENTGTKIETGAKTTLLPYSFSLVYQHSLSQKIILNAGISYRPVADLVPFVFVKPQWIINSVFQVAGTLSYGGTASYALGADAYLNLNNQFKINFGSDNILGIFIPKQTTSSSIFLRLRFNF